MTQRHFVHYIFLALILIAPHGWADILSPVNQVVVQTLEQYTDISIEFLWPVNVRSYSATANQGRQLQVDLSFVPGDGALLANTSLPAWSGGNAHAARSIYSAMQLDGGLDNARLTIDFVSSFELVVQRDSNPRKLLVRVKNDSENSGVLAELDVMSEQKAEGLLGEAEQALKNGAYDRAVALYTKILTQPEGPDTALAMEYLGLTRERKGQLAQAKAVYLDYLKRYPDGDGHVRVNQRLDSLLSLAQTPANIQTVGTASERTPESWSVYGGWSQYYRYADVSIDRSSSQYFDTTDAYTAQSDLVSGLDLTARKSGQSFDVETRFSGGYLYDFRDQDDEGGRHDSEVLLSDASLEVTHSQTDSLIRAGRQYSSGEGVLGRYDGVRVELPYHDSWRINFVGGRPVDLISDTTVDASERYFYGTSIDLVPIDSDWQYSMFAVEQRIDDMEDRQAVGGEVRYFTTDKSLFTLVDYDTSYQQLNTLLMIGTLSTSGGTVFGATVDYRLSPVLTTRNALFGQDVDSIEELGAQYSSSEIRQFAEDRTADSHYVTLSVTQPLAEDYQLYAAISEYEYGSTESSGGVEGYAGTGSEYGYEVQLITNNLLASNDSHIVSLRYFDGQAVKRTGLGLNSRFMLGDAWRLQPRLWLEYRDNINDDSNQWAVRPSLRLQYRWARRYHFELEIGRDWSSRDIPQFGDEEVGSNYLLASYRIDIN